mmetsp:Transcript_5179/g.8543  ORF Transcript_5179/g.8543 Transcript_5179/m.8543 type:complete len:98 (-) Transcript_5179:427-720(-)
MCSSQFSTTRVACCPFCRQDVTMSDTDANITRRAEANDPLVMCQEGVQQAKKGNSRRAFEYLTKAESDRRMGMKSYFSFGRGYYWWSSGCEIPSCVL